MVYHYTIPDIPPSLNKYAGRNNTWDYRKAKSQWSEKMMYYCMPKPQKPLEKAIVTLFFHFKDSRRRDLDNYLKFVLDGLTAAGVIHDDDYKTIEIRLKGTADKKGITEIFIEDVII